MVEGWTPTVAKCDAQLVAACKAMLVLDTAARRQSSNWIDMVNAAEVAMEGTYAEQANAGLRRAGGVFSGTLTPAQIRAALDPIMLHYGEAIGETTTDPVALARKWIPAYYHANTKALESRDFTFGAPAGITGTGTGRIIAHRLDADGYKPEHHWAEGYEAKVDEKGDAPGGATRNREIFRVRSTLAPWPDSLQRAGSRTDFRLRCVDHKDSIVKNAGFEKRSGTDALPTAIGDWVSSTAVIGDGTDYTFDTTNIYQPAAKSNETRRALNIKLTRTLTQRLDTIGRSLVDDRPYHRQLAYNREVGSATGTLVIRLGAHSATVVLAAQTGWNLLELTLNATSWAKNLGSTEPMVSIEWTRTGGTGLLIDDDITTPFFRIPNSNECLLAIGGQTPFVRGDYSTWSHSIQTSPLAVIQDFIWRGYDVYWPHNTTPTSGLTDPTL